MASILGLRDRDVMAVDACGSKAITKQRCRETNDDSRKFWTKVMVGITVHDAGEGRRADSTASLPSLFCGTSLGRFRQDCRDVVLKMRNWPIKLLNGCR